MTKKQAHLKGLEAIHRIGIVFKSNNFAISELYNLLDSERAILGFGRLLIQAAYMTMQKDGFCDQRFRDVAYLLLYQHYLKQKPKRKTKAKK